MLKAINFYKFHLRPSSYQKVMIFLKKLSLPPPRTVAGTAIVPRAGVTVATAVVNGSRAPYRRFMWCMEAIFANLKIHSIFLKNL
jgi:hypothetical protein